MADKRYILSAGSTATDQPTSPENAGILATFARGSEPILGRVTVAAGSITADSSTEPIPETVAVPQQLRSRGGGHIAGRWLFCTVRALQALKDSPPAWPVNR